MIIQQMESLGDVHVAVIRHAHRFILFIVTKMEQTSFAESAVMPRRL